MDVATFTAPQLTRTRIGFAPVDSGRMGIGVLVQNGDDYDLDADYLDADVYRPGRVIASTGYGDGCYDIVALHDADGHVVGVEVVFISSTVDDAIAARCEAEGVVFSSDDCRAVIDGTADDDARARYNAYNDAHQVIANEVWDAMLPTLEPAADATAKLVGTFDAAGSVGVGDPCYGAPSQTVEVRPGTYDAVLWGGESGDWGARTFRVGIYRRP